MTAFIARFIGDPVGYKFEMDYANRFGDYDIAGWYEATIGKTGVTALIHIEKAYLLIPTEDQ